MDTFIIAEAGANHNKDFNQALKLIDVAKTSGASAVKFHQKHYIVKIHLILLGIKI